MGELHCESQHRSKIETKFYNNSYSKSVSKNFAVNIFQIYVQKTIRTLWMLGIHIQIKNNHEPPQLATSFTFVIHIPD